MGHKHLKLDSLGTCLADSLRALLGSYQGQHLSNSLECVSDLVVLEEVVGLA